MLVNVCNIKATYPPRADIIESLKCIGILTVRPVRVVRRGTEVFPGVIFLCRVFTGGIFAVGIFT